MIRWQFSLTSVLSFSTHTHNHTYTHYWSNCTAVCMSAKHAGLSLDGRGKVRGEHLIVTGSRVALFFQMDKKTKGTKYLSWKIHYAA